MRCSSSISASPLSPCTRATASSPRSHLAFTRKHTRANFTHTGVEAFGLSLWPKHSDVVAHKARTTFPVKSTNCPDRRAIPSPPLHASFARPLIEPAHASNTHMRGDPPPRSSGPFNPRRPRPRTSRASRRATCAPGSSRTSPAGPLRPRPPSTPLPAEARSIPLRPAQRTCEWRRRAAAAPFARPPLPFPARPPAPLAGRRRLCARCERLAIVRARDDDANRTPIGSGGN